MANVYCRSGATGSGTGASWANAYTTLAAAITGAGASGIIYIASDHSELIAAGTTWAFSGSVSTRNKVISCNPAGAQPPTVADMLAGALIGTNGTFNVTFGGSVYMWGVTVAPGNGSASTGSLIFGSGGGQTFAFENCKVELRATGTGSVV